MAYLFTYRTNLLALIYKQSAASQKQTKTYRSLSRQLSLVIFTDETSFIRPLLFLITTSSTATPSGLFLRA